MPKNTTLDNNYATSKQRTAFRNTQAWQGFRRFVIARKGFTCELCEKKYKNISDLNIHHKYITQYDNLDPDRFLLLCKVCHEFIHIKYNTPAFAGMGLYGLVDSN